MAKRRGREKSYLYQLVKLAVFVAILVFIARATLNFVSYYIAQPFLVEGESMLPYYRDHDFLIVNKATYRLEAPKRDDIIIFYAPKSSNTKTFIKRIIGLPNERLHVKADSITVYNRAHPDGLTIDKTQLKDTALAEFLIDRGEYDVSLGYGQYFVLGDNRALSADSRSFGAIKAESIIGKPLFKLWPLF